MMTNSHKLMVRGISPDVYSSITHAATLGERSVEAEVRLALREHFTPPSAKVTVPAPLSRRAQWQSEVAERLQWLLSRLEEDRVFLHNRGNDLVSIASQIGETSPTALFDVLDGRGEGLTFDQTERLSASYSCSAEWLMTGNDSPFDVSHLGDDYHDFFLSTLDESGRLLPDTTFYFVRLTTGYDARHDGTLLVLRQRGERWDGRWAATCFLLTDGMGATGRSKLKNFLIFMKGQFGHVPIKSYIYDFCNQPDPEFGHHHPRSWLHSSLARQNDWLYQLYQGKRPLTFLLEEFEHELSEIENTAYRKIP